MHLLDTDTLTHLYAGNANVAERLRATNDPDIGTTIVTKAEMLQGRIDSILKATTGEELLRAQDLFLHTEALLSQILTIPFDGNAAVQFNRLHSAIFAKLDAQICSSPVLPLLIERSLSLATCVIFVNFLV